MSMTYVVSLLLQETWHIRVPYELMGCNMFVSHISKSTLVATLYPGATLFDVKLQN